MTYGKELPYDIWLKLPYDTLKEISFYSDIFASVIKTAK